MVKPRFIRRRILSVRNIRKITRTMERVAQSKVMKLTGRFAQARSFRRDLGHLLSVTYGAAHGTVLEEEVLAREPLTAPRPSKRVLLVCVTSNRGRCGGYNSRVIQAVRARAGELHEEDREPLLCVLGRKGLSYFRFYGQSVLIPATDMDESAVFRDVDGLIGDVITRYLRGDFDAVEVISTRLKTKVLQEVRRTLLLPFSPWAVTTGLPSGPPLKDTQNGEPGAHIRPIYYVEPDHAAAREVLMPMAVKADFYCALLEALLSEHAQRAIAMRSASDNADSMIKRLTLQYNRARQAQITNEMIEIVSAGEGSRE